jgi:uncharacterized membrane protein
MATALRNSPSGAATKQSAARASSRANVATSRNRNVRGITVVRAATIRRPAADLYAFWRKLENLMQVINHPVTITSKSENESHWSVSAPANQRVEWDAVIVDDERDRMISWRSQPGAQVENAGSVRFEPAPGDEGTEVTVSLEYDPPGGRLGAAIAKLTRDSASSQVYDALRRFKALMEAGEIPTIEGQPAGGPQRPRKGRK